MLVAAVAEAVRIHPAMQSCQFPMVSHAPEFLVRFERARGSPAQRLISSRPAFHSSRHRLHRRETRLDLVGRAERLPQRSADAQPVRPREHPGLCDRYLFSRNSRSPDWRAQLDTGWAAESSMSIRCRQAPEDFQSRQRSTRSSSGCSSSDTSISGKNANSTNNSRISITSSFCSGLLKVPDQTDPHSTGDGQGSWNRLGQFGELYFSAPSDQGA